MTTATAETPREVLQDRWDSVMEWSRNGGNPSPEYVSLAMAVIDLAAVVAGRDRDEAPLGIPDDDDLFAIGEIVVAAVGRHLKAAAA